MSADIAVRIAGPGDIPTLAALRAHWRSDADEPDFEARFAAWLRADGDRRTAWIAQRDQRAIGMATLFEYRRMPTPGRPPQAWGYLGNMFVDQHHRDAGVGTALLDAVLAEADARGYVRVVLSPSERAIPFYRRAGFIDAGPDAGGDRLLVRPAH